MDLIVTQSAAPAAGHVTVSPGRLINTANAEWAEAIAGVAEPQGRRSSVTANRHFPEEQARSTGEPLAADTVNTAQKGLTGAAPALVNAGPDEAASTEATIASGDAASTTTLPSQQQGLLGVASDASSLAGLGATGETSVALLVPRPSPTSKAAAELAPKVNAPKQPAEQTKPGSDRTSQTVRGDRANDVEPSAKDADLAQPAGTTADPTGAAPVRKPATVAPSAAVLATATATAAAAPAAQPLQIAVTVPGSTGSVPPAAERAQRHSDRRSETNDRATAPATQPLEIAGTIPSSTGSVPSSVASAPRGNAQELNSAPVQTDGGGPVATLTAAPPSGVSTSSGEWAGVDTSPPASQAKPELSLASPEPFAGLGDDTLSSAAQPVQKVALSALASPALPSDAAQPTRTNTLPSSSAAATPAAALPATADALPASGATIATGHSFHPASGRATQEQPPTAIAAAQAATQPASPGPILPATTAIATATAESGRPAPFAAPSVTASSPVATTLTTTTTTSGAPPVASASVSLLIPATAPGEAPGQGTPAPVHTGAVVTHAQATDVAAPGVFEPSAQTPPAQAKKEDQGAAGETGLIFSTIAADPATTAAAPSTPSPAAPVSGPIPVLPSAVGADPVAKTASTSRPAPAAKAPATGRIADPSTHPLSPTRPLSPTVATGTPSAGSTIAAVTSNPVTSASRSSTQVTMTVTGLPPAGALTNASASTTVASLPVSGNTASVSVNLAASGSTTHAAATAATLGYTPATPDAMAASIVAMYRSGHSSLVLRLDPPGLGSVSVHVALGGNGSVNVLFVPTIPQTAHLLQAGLGDLRQSMANSGLALGQAQIGGGGAGGGSSGGKPGTSSGNTGGPFAPRATVQAQPALSENAIRGARAIA